MKALFHSTLCIVFSVLAFVFFTETAWAQDPTQVDSTHYKVEFENEQVRVVRISYGAHEKSVMHEHPAGLAVFLTGGQTKFTYPDGETEDVSAEAGGVLWFEAVKHLPENTGDEPFELFFVEMKAKEEIPEAPKEDN